MARDHRKLQAFELADALALAVYRTTTDFPKAEMYGLTSQMRRAAVSAAANIVEGAARSGERDYVKFLNVALSSLREVGYYISFASRLGYLDAEAAQQLQALYDCAAGATHSLSRSLQARFEE